MFLRENDIAIITPENVTVYQPDGTEVQREIKVLDAAVISTGKSGFKHFMLKEMHEQPDVVNRLLAAYVQGSTITLPAGIPPLASIPQVNIIACGTAYYAGLCGKSYMEQYNRIPVNVDVASEFRYRKPPYMKGGLFIAVSQSGETADTLAALEDAKTHGQHILVLTNTPTSSMARAADTVLELHAGPEIAVASTKAFVAMQTMLALLTLHGMQQEGKDISTELQSLKELPSKIQQVLAMGDDIHALAQKLTSADGMLYLGRGPLAPLAYEGALKMKEISYIHAEGFASGEMKHGPIALVDEKLPVINLASSTDDLLEKTVSNMKEVEARKGKVVLITDKDATDKLDEAVRSKAEVLQIPVTNAFTSPLLFAIPLQMLAYHLAVEKGTDVDQPRNLAKSVTVE